MKNRLCGLLTRRLRLAEAAAIAIMLCVPIASSAANYFYVDGNGVSIGTNSLLAPLDIAGAIYSRLISDSDAASTTVDWSTGNVHSLTLSTSNSTLNFNNGHAGGEYSLILTQDGTGGRTVTWPASVEWEGGITPTLTASPNGIDKARFVYNGSTYLGEFAAAFGGVTISSPAAYWKLDEASGNASDATGNGNTMTNNGSTGFTSALINNGADFGSGNTTKSFYDASNLGYTNNAFAVSLWVKMNATQGASNNRMFYPRSRRRAGVDAQVCAEPLL